MLLCQFNFLLILAFYLVFFIYWWTIQDDLAAQSIALEASLTMPIAALILDYLAMKKIKQDDDLIIISRGHQIRDINDIYVS